MISNLYPKFVSFLKFIYYSKNQHGIHSPFVYDLVTKCFYDARSKHAYPALKSYRKLLYQNKNFIEVKDFGAGSKVFKSNLRQISTIAKNAGISYKRAKLLYRMIQYFQPKNILEIGSSLGLATVALSLGNKNSKIISLEGCPKTAALCELQLKKFDLQNVNVVNTEFSNYFTTSNITSSTFDLIYFDGNHSKKATLAYFNFLLPTTTNNSVWIFDDIHWSSDMEKAWYFIKNHEKVMVTIDTFQWGIVFFRRQQAKENFVVRV